MVVKVSLLSGAVASDGVLSIQTNGTTEAISISTGQVATFVNNPILTGGTINGVAYLNGSKVLTTGTALVFDGANLGVGQSSPRAKLDVNGGIILGNSQNLSWGNVYGAAIPLIAASSTVGIDFYANGSTSGLQMRLDAAGNLGLGVTPSAWGSSNKAIDVASYVSFGYRSATNGTVVSNNSYLTSGDVWTYKNNAAASAYQQIGGVHYWSVAASGTASTTITGFNTAAMTLDASGNLGVGTTPSYKLHVVGGQTRLDVSSAGTSLACLGTGSNFQVDHSTSGYATLINSANSGAAMIFKGSSESMRIDTSGNLLVGKTAGAAAVVGAELRPGGVILSTLSASTNADLTYQVYSTGAGAYRFYVGLGGTVYATSIVITAISDERLKENVRDLDTGLSSIMALKPRRFDWKEGKGQDKKDVAGFIAQEFETVFPECVSTSLAGEDGIEYKNINHETLIPTLVKAIQELETRLAALEAK